jgi:hypothetical protein
MSEFVFVFKCFNCKNSINIDDDCEYCPDCLAFIETNNEINELYNEENEYDADIPLKYQDNTKNYIQKSKKKVYMMSKEFKNIQQIYKCHSSQ